MKLYEVAKALDAQVVGNEFLEVYGVSSVENPRPFTLVFCKKPDQAQNLPADAIAVVNSAVERDTYLLTNNIKLSLAKALEIFYPEEHPVGVSDKAYIEGNVHIGEDVYVGPFVYVGKGVRLERGVKVYPFSYVGEYTVIGEGSVIFSGVHIYPRCVIGKGVRIHSGSVIGADGFGYYVGKEGIIKLSHAGNVIVEDYVEIGANTTIDRALLDSTVIGKHTKIDNLVMIGHNCKVGEGNIIVSQVGLSGSVKTGKGVVLAGQVGVADHVSIGDNVVVSAKSGVATDLEAGKVYGANLPAIEWNKWKRIYLYLLRLPELFKKEKRHEDKGSSQPGL